MKTEFMTVKCAFAAKLSYSTIILLSFSIWVLFSAFVSQTDKEVIIYGKVTGEESVDIIYTVPIKGLYYRGFRDTVKTDAEGNYQIKLKISKPVFVNIFINKKGRLLILEPNQKLNVDFHQQQKESFFSIKGKNEDGQRLLNELPSPLSLKMVGTTRFLDNLTIDEIKSEIESRKQEELSKFRGLLTKNQISLGFYNLVKIDRECYYSAIKANYAFVRFTQINPDSLDLFPKPIERLWIETFQENPATNKKFFYSRWWFDYAENFLNKEEYLSEGFSITELRELYKRGHIHTHNLNIAQKYLSGVLLESYTARYLHHSVIQSNNEKELIDLFEKFSKIYPNSPYSVYISPFIKPIAAFHRKIEADSEIDYVENYNNLNTLNDCIKSFEGKPLFIDVWASWCGPCKEEFKHKSKLEKLLQDKGFELLYISIDDNRRKDNWEKAIKGFNLNGKHIRANESLNLDLRNIFSENGAIVIPWYLIIDKNGKIIAKYASRPSQLNLLEKQLEEVRIKSLNQPK